MTVDELNVDPGAGLTITAAPAPAVDVGVAVGVGVPLGLTTLKLMVNAVPAVPEPPLPENGVDFKV